MSFWRSLVAALRLSLPARLDQASAVGQPMNLVVGLGNHGVKYEATRHNVGYDVIDRLAEKLGPAQFRRQFSGQLATVRHGETKVHLLKPETYMNESGRSVQAVLAFYDLPAASLLVICDDLNLPIGAIRVRKGGSDGGHKGLRSLAQHLGTTEYPRLRVGIGAAPPHIDPADFVLSRFGRDERPQIDEAIDRAVDAVLVWCEAGVDKCMNRFN